MELDDSVFKQAVSRRSVLKVGAAGLLASQMALLEKLAWMPDRLALAAPALPDIQHDVGNFIAPAFSEDGVMVRFGPVFTALVPAKLTRTPTQADQRHLAQALDTMEQVLGFSPAGVIPFIGYGLPYFARLPQPIVNAAIPRLAGFGHKFGSGSVLKEARPSVTDVSPHNPGIQKRTPDFNVPVRIESNDLLITLCSDSLQNISEILAWLQGSNQLGGRRVASPRVANLIVLQETRLIFQQLGLVRKVAEAVGFEFARRINRKTPMWMGFGDQQVNASGPAAITTFVGNRTAKLSNAKRGDYFDNGSIQHLSHVLLDLVAWYQTPQQDPAGKGEPLTERIQYMFRSNQRGTQDGMLSLGNADQFANGGVNQTFFENTFQGFDDELGNVNAAGKTFDPKTGVGTFNGEHRIGHTAGLHRFGRAPDGTPLHIRHDGAGLSALDVPSGHVVPTLEFMAFLPAADQFALMRDGAASLDLSPLNGPLVAEEDRGLERFITATRRQNFLSPPRRHRAFPLVEFT